MSGICIVFCKRDIIFTSLFRPPKCGCWEFAFFYRKIHCLHIAFPTTQSVDVGHLLFFFTKKIIFTSFFRPPKCGCRAFAVFFNPGVTSKNTDKHNDELDLFTNMFTTARSWEPDIHGELVSNGGYGGKTTAQKGCFWVVSSEHMWTRRMLPNRNTDDKSTLLQSTV